MDAPKADKKPEKILISEVISATVPCEYLVIVGLGVLCFLSMSLSSLSFYDIGHTHKSFRQCPLMIVLPEQKILTNTNKRCNEDYGKDKYSFSILSRQLVP